MLAPLDDDFFMFCVHLGKKGYWQNATHSFIKFSQSELNVQVFRFMDSFSAAKF